MLYNRKIDRLLIVLVPAGLFIYASTRPHMQLSADMPRDFVDFQATADPKQREAEERNAREYWNLALTVIQWKYTYGSTLPDSPPEEFRLKRQVAPESESDTSSRSRYWRRLDKVWLQPTSWVTSRSWRTDWLTAPVEDCARWIDNHVRNLIQRG